MSDKIFHPTDIEFKSDGQGRFRAKFATLNVVDKQGDVVLHGAIPNGKAVVVSSYEHSSIGLAAGVPVLPPVGKAVISVVGNAAVADGQFFLKTSGGRETYERVKAMGDLQQWSFGYQIVDHSTNPLELKAYGPTARRILKSLHIEEISPVVLGAGIDTGTMSIEGDGKSGLTSDPELIAMRDQIAKGAKVGLISITELVSKDNYARLWRR